MKIKIDKKIWLIVGIVIFAIVFGNLVRIYVQEAREQSKLRTSIAAQQTLLRKLTTDTADLEDSWEQAESLLGESQARLPASIESVEYGEDLFKIAADYKLDLTEFTPSTPADKKVGTVTYSVATFMIKVEGSLDNILEFVYALRTGGGFKLPWSAEVKSINIDMGDSMTMATITLEIYGYKG